MAFLFDDATSEALTGADPTIAGLPFSVSCWFRTDTDAADQCMISIANSTVSNKYFSLVASMAQTGDPLRWVVVSGGGAISATSTSISTNTWHHAFAVEAATNSRFAYLDNGGAVENTTTKNPGSVDVVDIGRVGSSSPFGPFSGEIADVAIWDVALAADERQALADGVSPLLVRAESLVYYVPLIRHKAELIQSIVLSDVSTPVAADAAPPLMGFPQHPSIIAEIQAAGAGLSIPVAMHQYARLRS